MTASATELLREFIVNLMSDREFAARYAEDPTGTLTAEGVTDVDLSGVDVSAVVGSAAADPGVPAEARTALHSHSGSTPPPASGGSPSVEHVVQHLNYVTYATYEGDETITQNLDLDVTNVTDNSFDLDVDGNVFGDIDASNVSASGDGAVAGGDDVNAATGDGAVANSGDGDVNAATGDGSTVIDGDVNSASGDGAQVIDGDNFGQANTGDGAVQAGDDISGAVNTGVNTGIVADELDDAVVGDGNQTAQVDGGADESVFNFGDGDVANLPDAEIEDSAVTFGEGDATNVSGNTVDDGSAISAGDGDAKGNNEDNDTTVTTVSDDDTTINDNDTTVNDNDTTVTDIDTTNVDTDIDDSIVSGDDTVIGA
ncbi:hypothetical protein [Actinoplanes subglobosus]|uniref:Uncharacterized protein n=1 Tax=Actinoplanes subglobosus TaxID=1547892 RepID=A0ABV8J2Q9_9ACTN